MKIIVQGNHISSLTISFEYFLEKRKVINRVGSKIESAKSYPDAIIEIKLYEIKAGHMKTNNSLDIKNHLSHQTNRLSLMNNHILIAPNGHY